MLNSAKSCFTHTHIHRSAAIKRFGKIRRPAYIVSQVCLQQNGLQCQVHGRAMACNATTGRSAFRCRSKCTTNSQASAVDDWMDVATIMRVALVMFTLLFILLC